MPAVDPMLIASPSHIIATNLVVAAEPVPTIRPVVTSLSHTMAASNQINQQQRPETFASLLVARNPRPLNISRKVNHAVLITSSPYKAELVDNKEKQEKKLETMRNKVEMAEKRKPKKQTQVEKNPVQQRKPMQRAKQGKKRKSQTFRR